MLCRVVSAAGLTAISLMLFAGQAMAGTSTSTVGQLFAPDGGNTCDGNFTYLQTHVSSGTSYAISATGVITSWSFQIGSSVIPGLELKVARPQPDGSYLFVGEWAAGVQTPNAVNNYPADVAVQAGDIIGFHEAADGSPVPCAHYMGLTNNDGYTVFSGDPALGTAPSPNGSDTQTRFPVSATVTTTIPDQPSNAISLGKPHLNTAKGTATEPVAVPGPGVLTLTGKGVVTQRPEQASASRVVDGFAIVNLPVKTKGKTRKKLNKTGKAKVKVTITFTPTGGSPNSQVKTIKLKKTLR